MCISRHRVIDKANDALESMFGYAAGRALTAEDPHAMGI
jgi:hypothetical protein